MNFIMKMISVVSPPVKRFDSWIFFEIIPSFCFHFKPSFT